jgi:sucrose-6-phosphate hydrolase SacC (GH32 family)
MKNIVIFFVIFSLISCSRSIDVKQYNLSKIEIESIELLRKNEGTASNLNISNTIEIKKLNAEEVYITNEGLFIVLNSFFVVEKGLFIPKEGVNVDISTGNDPLFIKLTERVFQYEIKG